MDDNNIKTDPSVTADTDDTKDVVDQKLDALLARAKAVNQEIEETNAEANKSMDELEEKVDKSIASVDGLCADLNKVDSETGDELDKIILAQAEEVASE